MLIVNAANIPLNQNQGALPNVSGALNNYLQQMTFSVVNKSIVDFQVVETKTDFSFAGVWQQFSQRQLMIKPEGQRLWKWYSVWSTIALEITPDMVITYLGVQYRVMAEQDFSLYGYYSYELIQDFTGSGPT